MTDRELMKMALDALEDLHRTGDTQVFDMCYAPKLLPALLARLAQPEPEPVAWLEPEWGERICPEVGYEVTITDDHPRDLCWIPLYPAPPQRVYCSCGDGIVPDDGALCGTCVSLKDAVKQEPVAWHEPGAYGNVTVYKKWAEENGWLPLYTAPPQREWQGLTDGEIKEIVGPWGDQPIKGYTRKLFDQIEAKLKEKNT